MSEEWKPVPSVPLLEASTLGRIRSLPYQTPMPRGGSKTNQMAATYGIPSKAVKTASYSRWQVTFRRKVYKVHRLVCEAFNGPPPPGKPFALHRDEDSQNNTPDNLYWGTQKENLNAPGFISYCKSGRPGERHI